MSINNQLQQIIQLGEEAKRKLALDALNQLETYYLDLQKPQKDQSPLQVSDYKESKSQNITNLVKNDKKIKQISPTIQNKNSQTQSSSEQSSKDSIKQYKKKRQHQKKKVYSNSSSSSKSKSKSPSRKDLLNFVIDNNPFVFNEKRNFPVSYNLVGEQQRRLTQERNIAEKLGNLQNKKEQVEEIEINSDQEFQREIAENIGIFDPQAQSRYFKDNPMECCFRCKQPGHQEKICPIPLSRQCNMCMSKEHTTDKCVENACFKCHKSGHRKMECPVIIKRTYFCQKCRQNGHQLEDCGIIVLNYKIELNQIMCINCFKYGHSTCEFSLNDTIFE